MSIVKNFRTYLLEDEFKMTIYKYEVDIINYESIGHFDENKVMVNYSDGQIIIKGKNLVVSKLVNDEVLVRGEINNIELR